MAESLVLEKKEMLAKLKRHSITMSNVIDDLCAASEEKSIIAAEKLLAAHFLLTPGLAHRLDLTAAEAAALGNLAAGRGYSEATAAPEPHQRPLSYDEKNKIFLAEEAARKAAEG